MPITRAATINAMHQNNSLFCLISYVMKNAGGAIKDGLLNTFFGELF